MNDLSCTCWICGDTATTGEHQQKKTDMTQMFGRGAFEGVVKHDFDSNTKLKIQGPNSRALKYRKNLCAICNNQRTQPYDLAYTQFAAYVRDNFCELKNTLTINTNVIFGKRVAKEQRRNLFLYFVKAFGCQLHDKKLPVPPALREALIGKNYGNTFRVSVCLNLAVQEFVQNFPLEGGQNERGQPVDFFWAQDNGWFTVVHAHNRPISTEFGEEWFGKSRQFKLGVWSASNYMPKCDLGDTAK